MEAEQVEERAGNQNYVTEDKKLIRDHTRVRGYKRSLIKLKAEVLLLPLT